MFVTTWRLIRGVGCILIMTLIIGGSHIVADSESVISESNSTAIQSFHPQFELSLSNGYWTKSDRIFWTEPGLSKFYQYELILKELRGSQWHIVQIYSQIISSDDIVLKDISLNENQRYQLQLRVKKSFQDWSDPATKTFIVQAEKMRIQRVDFSVSNSINDGDFLESVDDSQGRLQHLFPNQAHWGVNIFRDTQSYTIRTVISRCFSVNSVHPPIVQEAEAIDEKRGSDGQVYESVIFPISSLIAGRVYRCEFDIVQDNLQSQRIVVDTPFYYGQVIPRLSWVQPLDLDRSKIKARVKAHPFQVMDVDYKTPLKALVVEVLDNNGQKGNVLEFPVDESINEVSFEISPDQISEGQLIQLQVQGITRKNAQSDPLKSEFFKLFWTPPQLSVTKTDHYPDQHRVVLSFDVTDNGSGFYYLKYQVKKEGDEWPANWETTVFNSLEVGSFFADHRHRDKTFLVRVKAVDRRDIESDALIIPVNYRSNESMTVIKDIDIELDSSPSIESPLNSAPSAYIQGDIKMTLDVVPEYTFDECWVRIIDTQTGVLISEYRYQIGRLLSTQSLGENIIYLQNSETLPITIPNPSLDDGKSYFVEVTLMSNQDVVDTIQTAEFIYAQPASLDMSVMVYPNPINPSTGSATIQCSVSKTVDIWIAIHDLNGEELWQYSTQLVPGLHPISWSVKHQDGRDLSNGVYLIYVMATDIATGQHYRDVIKLGVLR